MSTVKLRVTTCVFIWCQRYLPNTVKDFTNPYRTRADGPGRRKTAADPPGLRSARGWAILVMARAGTDKEADETPHLASSDTILARSFRFVRRVGPKGARYLRTIHRQGDERE